MGSRTSRAALALAPLLVLASTAGAVTIDFEGVGGPGCTTFLASTPLQTQGFTLLGAGDPAALIVCPSGDASGASNDSRYLFSGAEPITGQAPIAMMEDGGGVFSLVSFDATELLLATPGDAVRVTGYDATLVNVVDQVTFVFDGLIDGPGGVEDFETFLLPASFENIGGVVWEGVDQGSGTMFYAIDNIVVAPIPEPTTALLLASGLAGLAVRRRCRET